VLDEDTCFKKFSVAWCEAYGKEMLQGSFYCRRGGAQLFRFGAQNNTA